MDFQIINYDKETGLASLGIPPVPRKISGIEKLVQVVVLTLLKNGGRDIFEPDVGSGLRAAIGQYNFTEGDEVKNLVVQRIRAVEQQILSFQAGALVSPAEKLKRLEILGVAFDEATFQTLIRIQVFSEAGQNRDVIV